MLLVAARIGEFGDCIEYQSHAQGMQLFYGHLNNNNIDINIQYNNNDNSN